MFHTCDDSHAKHQYAHIPAGTLCVGVCRISSEGEVDICATVDSYLILLVLDTVIVDDADDVTGVAVHGLSH